MFVTPDGWIRTIVYMLGILATIAVSCFVLKRFKLNPYFYILVMFVYLVVSSLLAKPLSTNGFDMFRLIAFGYFLGGTGLLVALSWVAWSSKLKVFGVFIGVLAVISIGISVDCLIIEPLSLETRFEEIVTDKVTKPVRIAIVADIQTDSFGDYERAALAKVLEQKPDLILMAGDYLQCFSYADFQREAKSFRRALTELGWKAPLGVYAVQGDVEVGGFDPTRLQSSDAASIRWKELFAGFPITVIPSLQTFQAGEVAITGMSLAESIATKCDAPKITDRFHIVFGHNPNFMLETKADLLVGGHTHGGQVQVPKAGPLVTYSIVPREWAAGCHVTTKNGSHAIISRGIGMERLDAPRLRFLCHPEIVICDLVPAKKRHK